MTKFKVGDRIKMKYFKNEEDYESQSNRCGWTYENFLDNYNDDISTVVDIGFFDDNRMVTTETKSEKRYYWLFQIEKVNLLKIRLQLVKELLK
jgi:hypothetical protein